MASKNFTEKCTQLKGEKALQSKLAQKLQLDLERDILRLFQDSCYSDIKFTIDSSFILAHSCILRTRAARFYKFIFAQFEFHEENGVSIFNIYHASFTCLHKFVENIYTNNHSFQAEDSIIKHLQETKSQTVDKPKPKVTDSRSVRSAITPDSDLFFTPRCSPSDLQKPFASSKLKIKENDVASYYKIVVDDIPVEEGKKINSEEEKILEKELAEQDELFSSFQTIFLKKRKNKPNSLSLGTSSQSAKKAKPKFDRKLDSNIILFDIHDRKRYGLPHWKPNPVSDKYFGLKTKEKNLNLKEKIETESYLADITNSLGDSDMDVSATNCDSGLDNSLICQQETSPKENTVSETSGVDLTEGAINEEIPIDETISKQSSESSVSSEAGTWDANDDFRNKSPLIADSTDTIGKNQDDLMGDREEICGNDIFSNVKKSIKDCETFLFMERQGSIKEFSDKKNSTINVPDSLYDNVLETEKTYQYANENEAEPRNYDGEKNYYVYEVIRDKNLDDINPTETYEGLDLNETEEKGVSSDVINSNFEYYDQPDILRNVRETQTPPCTPKRLKTENKESEDLQRRPVSWENNNSTGVSNYFIDASSLLDDDEIISPPVSLTYKSLRNDADAETKTVEEEPQVVCKKVVTNFYSPDSSDDVVSYQKENEKRQGEYIFRNSIPHYSKHEVEENQVLDMTERMRGGADHFQCEVADEESEQVVPSADIECSPTVSSINRQTTVECDYSGTDFFEPPPEYELESPEDHADGNISESQTEVKDVSSSSVCSGSPSVRRRNELAPILSGGMDFVEEEKKVQKKSSQAQGEAWIVTFDDAKKPKNRFASSETGSESGEDMKTVHLGLGQNKRGDERILEAQPEKSDPRLFPVEKSSSLGYFIDFGKENPPEPVGQDVEIKPEKKNMFSMFIGMDDESAPRRPKPVLEREGTFDKTPRESTKNELDNENKGNEGKKSFFMFIESDTKCKQPPKKFTKLESEAVDPRKTYLRMHSYTIKGDADNQGKLEAKTDIESSSDSSLPYSESNVKTNRPKGRLPLPLNKFRSSALQDTKMTAWSETKQPSDETVSSESWLRTKDIQVNYKGKGNDVCLKKDSTFVMSNEYKDKHQKNRYKEHGKPAERDSGVILSDKGDDSFVRLSDLDSFDLQARPKDRMSQSISEDNRKSVPENTSLSKSIESEGKINCKMSYDKRASQSLSRLFPNLSAQSLAYIARKDGDKTETDVQASETSEVSSSMQSSVEPVGLEISTSETDVSTHGGGASRLGEDLLKMFLEEISPDVVVEVNGRRIKAHKCVLASRCQYFASKLSGGWVESAGNVISLQGFSYNAVHFALRYIYSGESRIPESLNIVELATLADMLCLDGLQEIISYNLKVKYCHSFHVPCSVCSVGVLDCLPVAAAYGLDDLYRKCLRWITKYFVKIWPTKTFGNLPKELLEKCYQHYVVHMTVDNVLDTIISIDKVRGSLPNVRWTESVSRLVKKLHDATVRYIAEHFSSILTSDNFLALGKEEGWSVSRLEDSLMEAIRYLPPEQACWSHARLHRILSVAAEPDPPPEMSWNEDFLKLLQVIAELVENSLIKQAPRAAKSKAWRQMEPELRSRIQEAACLVLPEPEPSPTYRRSNYLRREVAQPHIPQTTKSRNLEIRQIKLAMTQQANKTLNPSRPLSLQIDHRPKKDSRFIPLRPSVSTSSVRRTEPPIEGIRKTQSRSQIIGSTTEPKKTINPRYSDVKSRYLEPRSPQKLPSEKAAPESSHRRTLRNYVSSSDSSRNCSPALRSSNSRSSIPQPRKANVEGSKQSKASVPRCGSATVLDSRRDRNHSNRSDTTSSKTLSRLTGEENMSSDSLCTDSLLSEKEATVRRRPGKENLEEKKKFGNVVTKSASNSSMTRRQSCEPRVTKTAPSRKLIMPKSTNENKFNPPKRFLTGNVTRTNAPSSKAMTVNRNQKNSSKSDANLVNGNANRKRIEVDSENNKKNSKESEPAGVERSGTFLKEEPTILKKPSIDSVESEV